MYIRRVLACLLASLLAVIPRLVLHVVVLVVIQPVTVISLAILVMIAALTLIKLAVYKAMLLKLVRTVLYQIPMWIPMNDCSFEFAGSIIDAYF